MKKGVFCAFLLILLGLSGCACFGTCAIKQDVIDYGYYPIGISGQAIGRDWNDFWKCVIHGGKCSGNYGI